MLLVSHDRQFMDNVVTSIMVFEGDGVINEYVGGYTDWARKGGKLFSFEGDEKNSASNVKNAQPAAAKSIEAKKPAAKKLSYKDQRELDGLPALIEKLEKSQSELEQKMSQPEFYDNQDGDKSVEETLKQVAQVQNELEQAFERWEALEALRSGS